MYSFSKIIQTICLVSIFCSSISITSGIHADVLLQLPDGGFHRTLKYNIDFGDFNEENCHVALYFEFPSSFYVDVDQIADLTRKGEIIACSVGEFDVELFAESAGTQNVTVCSSLIGSKVSLSLPIHQRYHEAREGGGYLELRLPKPKLLLGCRDRIKGHRVSKIDLCFPCSEFAEKWREIPYNLLPEDFIWYVPVGDTSMLSIVNWVTNMVVTIGTICILWTLYRVNVLDQKKLKET